MSRPKSAGSGTRSFLDDLLGNDDDNLLPSTSSISSIRPSTSVSRQRKSVRFFDESDDPAPAATTQPTTSPATQRSRPPVHSSTLESLLESSSPKQQQQNRSNKSDWLGIGAASDDDETFTIRKPVFESRTASPSLGAGVGGVGGVGAIKNRPATAIGTMTATATSSNNSTTNSSSSLAPDWLTTGLKARQSRQQDSSSSGTTTSSKPGFLQEDSSIAGNQQQQQQRSWQPKLLLSSQQQQMENSSSVSSSEQHLSAHKRIAPTEFHQSNTTATTTAGHLKTTPEIIDSQTIEHFNNQHSTISTLPTPQTQESLERIISSDQSDQQQMLLTNAATSTATPKSPITNDTQSITVLQTKLRILSLEKSFLEQTVEQMKNNHHDELKAMISLYEQQMKLTSDMYKRHEDMIQEERDRRIIELKSQLEQSEKELETMRSKYKERLVVLEDEYHNEMKRIKESYEQATKQMIDEHELEMKRLKERLQNDNESSLKTSSDLLKHQTKNVTELMAKWEESAFNIEKLQRSVIAKQEELVREHLLNNGDDLLANKIQDFEKHWKIFLTDMQEQRSLLTETMKQEYEKHFEKEETKLKESELRLEEQKNELALLRQQFANEVNEWRHNESIDAEKLRTEREKLKEEVALFEERRSLLETLYNERKIMLDQEQSRITKHSDELIKKQTDLDHKETQMMKSWMELHHEQQQYNDRCKRFEQEKEHITQLGHTLTKRAEELEKLSQMALKEKLDGINAMDEIERLRNQLKKESDHIEKIQSQIELDKHRLVLERNQLEQQFKMLKDLKDSIVCNLCGNVLNRGNSSMALLTNNRFNNNQNDGLFYGLINGGYIMRQQSNNMATFRSTDQDVDKTMLLWQMAAQQDAASLAEETKFLKIIMNQQKLDRSQSNKS